MIIKARLQDQRTQYRRKLCTADAPCEAILSNWSKLKLETTKLHDRAWALLNTWRTCNLHLQNMLLLQLLRGLRLRLLWWQLQLHS